VRSQNGRCLRPAFRFVLCASRGAGKRAIFDFHDHYLWEDYCRMTFKKSSADLELVSAKLEDRL